MIINYLIVFVSAVIYGLLDLIVINKKDFNFLKKERWLTLLYMAIYGIISLLAFRYLLEKRAQDIKWHDIILAVLCGCALLKILIPLLPAFLGLIAQRIDEKTQVNKINEINSLMEGLQFDDHKITLTDLCTDHAPRPLSEDDKILLNSDIGQINKNLDNSGKLRSLALIILNRTKITMETFRLCVQQLKDKDKCEPWKNKLKNINVK